MGLLDRVLGPRRRPRVLLVSKRECPLCDEAKEALDHAARRVAFDLETKLVDDDEALRAAHALEVPVVFIDGKKSFFGKVSPLLLLRALRGAASRALPILALVLAGLATTGRVRAEEPSASFVLVTDASWKGRGGAEPGWERAGFNDARWLAVSIQTDQGPHYAVANVLGIASRARWIWPARLEREGCVRREFAVPPSFRCAELLFACDDRAEVRINGALVGTWDTGQAPWAWKGCASVVDVSPWLEPGRNVLAVTVLNRMGPMGFVAELRVDGPSFIPARLGTAPIGSSLAADLETFAACWRSGPARARRGASDRASEVVRVHGLEASAPFESLAARASDPQVRWSARRALASLVPALDPPRGSSAHFGLGRLSPDELQSVLEQPDERAAVLLRNLTAASALRVTSPAGLERALRAALRSDAEHVRARGLAFARFLGARALVPEVASVLSGTGPTELRARAASALGVLGGADAERALEAAFSSNDPIVARAARRAWIKVK